MEGIDSTSDLTMVEAINETLHAEMTRDNRVVLLGEDVARNGGVFRATEGLIEKFGEQRVVDTPISEAAIVGSTVGLAITGLVPVAEIQFLGFAYQAMHQLAGQVAFDIGPRVGSNRLSPYGRHLEAASALLSCTQTPSRRSWQISRVSKLSFQPPRPTPKAYWPRRSVNPTLSYSLNHSVATGASAARCPTETTWFHSVPPEPPAQVTTW